MKNGLEEIVKKAKVALERGVSDKDIHEKLLSLGYEDFLVELALREARNRIKNPGKKLSEPLKRFPEEEHVKNEEKIKQKHPKIKIDETLLEKIINSATKGQKIDVPAKKLFKLSEKLAEKKSKIDFAKSESAKVESIKEVSSKETKEEKSKETKEEKISLGEFFHYRKSKAAADNKIEDSVIEDDTTENVVKKQTSGKEIILPEKVEPVEKEEREITIGAVKKGDTSILRRKEEILAAEKKESEETLNILGEIERITGMIYPLWQEGHSVEEIVAVLVEAGFEDSKIKLVIDRLKRTDAKNSKNAKPIPLPPEKKKKQDVNMFATFINRLGSVVTKKDND